MSWSKADVTPEYDLHNLSYASGDQGNELDILIGLPECTIMIEHKIKSAEDASAADGTVTQLSRYTQAAEENFPNFRGKLVKLFLTPDGTAPKDDDTWQTLSHRTVVKRLAELLRSSALSNVARHNLTSLIFDLITGPLAVDEAVWREMITRLRRLDKDDASYPSWRRWSRRKVPEFDIMLSITEALYG